MNTNIFDRDSDLYYRDELEASFKYLIYEAKKTNIEVWLDAHCQELAILQMVLCKVPKTAGAKTIIVADKIEHTPFVSAMLPDMKRVEANGKVFYWINLAD